VSETAGGEGEEEEGGSGEEENNSGEKSNLALLLEAADEINRNDDDEERKRPIKPKWVARLGCCWGASACSGKVPQRVCVLRRSRCGLLWIPLAAVRQGTCLLGSCPAGACGAHAVHMRFQLLRPSATAPHLLHILCRALLTSCPRPLPCSRRYLDEDELPKARASSKPPKPKLKGKAGRAPREHPMMMDPSAMGPGMPYFPYYPGFDHMAGPPMPPGALRAVAGAGGAGPGAEAVQGVGAGGPGCRSAGAGCSRALCI
jgi:hypothetical protein